MIKGDFKNPSTVVVGDIKGDFYIPSYQRGYRWRDEVRILLDDLVSISDFEHYCLQPIVVKKMNNKYELIDGQQRITTLFLIFQFIKSFHSRMATKFSIEYETRKNSKTFLENISDLSYDFQPHNIDELFISNAYNEIDKWIKDNNEDPFDIAINLYHKFSKYIHVIWYEIDQEEDSIALFTRLNIGKIPLTNAELIKALFLRKDSSIDANIQIEIATIWDRIEQELRNDNFWYFLTNADPEQYPTRIELVFDLMANKNISVNKERFSTFYHFDQLIKESSVTKKQIWDNIQEFYQRAKELYEDHNLYHKVGYLIASNSVALDKIMSDIFDKRKSELSKYLDSKITSSISTPNKTLYDLHYERDYELIHKILLLFNTETIRLKGDPSLKLSFRKFKQNRWSLEHIHAQQTESLNRKEQWVTWLDAHLRALMLLTRNQKVQDLIIVAKNSIDDPNLNKERFEEIAGKIIKALSEDSNLSNEIHSISNLALLDIANNSVLSNSTFDVKRNKVLSMDKDNEYILPCTRNVFLKYYTNSEVSQLHFWGKEDRKSYMSHIKKVLTQYLQKCDQEVHNE